MFINHEITRFIFLLQLLRLAHFLHLRVAAISLTSFIQHSCVFCAQLFGPLQAAAARVQRRSYEDALAR